MAQRDYTNGEITVHWDSDLCIHCQLCWQGLPAVFDLNRRPLVPRQATGETTLMLIALAILIAALRIIGITAAWFQAVAHLFVGGLFGSWWQSRDPIPLILAVALSVLEVICFLVFKFVVK